MALAKYGAGIVQISGSIAGDVHARNRFGNYIRPRTKPINKKTTRQNVVRALLTYLTEYWHSSLSDTNRGNWDAYAAAVSWLNRIGETVHMTGFNMFCRCNISRIFAGEVVLAAAPTVLSLPTIDTTLLCSDESIANQTFTFTCNNTGWGTTADLKLYINIYQGIPQLTTRNFFAGPWRYMGAIDHTAGAAGTKTLTCAFAFALGQKVFFQARLLTVTGRTSNLWNPAARIIIADV